MAREAAGDRVNAEAHVDAPVAQALGEVRDGVLGLGGRHP